MYPAQNRTGNWKLLFEGGKDGGTMKVSVLCLLSLAD